MYQEFKLFDYYMYFIACDTRENVGRKISSKSKISTINIYEKKKTKYLSFPSFPLKKEQKAGQLLTSVSITNRYQRKFRQTQGILMKLNSLPSHYPFCPLLYR